MNPEESDHWKHCSGKTLRDQDVSTSFQSNASSDSEDRSKEAFDTPTSPNGEEGRQNTRQEAANALKKKIEELDKEMAAKKKEIDELYAWLAAEAKRRLILIRFIESFWHRRGIPLPDTTCNELRRQKAIYVALKSRIDWEVD